MKTLTTPRRSSRFIIARLAISIGFALIIGCICARPAMAHWHGDRHGWHHRNYGYGYGYRNYNYNYAPRNYYSAEPDYYQSPNYYYTPPPVYYNNEYRRSRGWSFIFP